MTERSGMTRSSLLYRAGAAVVALGTAGVAGTPRAFAGPHRYTGRWLAGELSIVQWQHFVPSYNGWFRAWAQRWGEENDVEVTVDLETYTELPALAAAEVKARRGHDVFGFLSPPARFETEVIDHRSIVEAIEARSGRYGDLGRLSTYNPRTRRYFGVSDYFVPAPLIWRHDVWNSIGHSPATWEHVREAAPLLRASGHPIGIGQSSEPDSNTALLSLLMCFGAYLQDEAGMVTLQGDRAVEAVAYLADLHARGGDPTVFAWGPTSNNQLVLSGRGSMIVNAISPIRRADDLGMPFASELWIWPVPGGPGGRHAVGQYTAVYSVWKFARNIEAAERFIADVCTAAPEAVPASSFFNYPSFPGAYPLRRIYRAAAANTRPPKGKYSVLTTVARDYTRNVGYPGPSNAAVQEVLDRYLVPRMFAQVSQGRVSAAESVRATSAEMRAIWRKWRAAGLV